MFNVVIKTLWIIVAIIINIMALALALIYFHLAVIPTFVCLAIINVFTGMFISKKY